MNRGLNRAGSHSVVLGAATAMLMALATTGTSVSAAETSNDSSAGRAASGLGSQLVPVRFTSEEYRLRGEVYWHRGDQQPAVAVTPGDRAFARGAASRASHRSTGPVAVTPGDRAFARIQ